MWWERTGDGREERFAADGMGSGRDDGREFDHRRDGVGALRQVLEILHNIVFRTRRFT